MSRIHAMIGLAFVSATADVHAQHLLEVEGIELRGTARVVEFGAATCNVVEERETETSYEQKKASHGQPHRHLAVGFLSVRRVGAIGGPCDRRLPERLPVPDYRIVSGSAMARLSPDLLDMLYTMQRCPALNALPHIRKELT